MPLTAPLVRTALATVYSDVSVTDRICQFYLHMNDWQSATGGLSELGRDTVTDLFNGTIDGFVDNSYQLPTVH